MIGSNVSKQNLIDESLRNKLCSTCERFFYAKRTDRGGSRTSPRRGRQSLGGRLPNILVIFSEKPYEIKEILVRRGARAGCAPHIRASHEPYTFTTIIYSMMEALQFFILLTFLHLKLSRGPPSPNNTIHNAY